MSLVMFCFPCCVDEQPQVRRRPRIDRTQIGLPTNFQHTGHIGSGEVAAGFDVHQVQNSMMSKGGYDQMSNEISNTPTGIDISQKDSNGMSLQDNSETNNLSETINRNSTLDSDGGLLTS